ncbi:DUF3158 family protein [Salmonella enterica]|nr:DUF3158 family protein [Salmonella enterica]
MRQLLFTSPARKRTLKGLLKAFKGKGDTYLLRQALEELRESLLQEQMQLKQAARALPARSLPLILTCNRARSGACFLCWRNLDNNASGESALVNYLQQPDVSDALKDGLKHIEHQRQMINMLVSVTTSMLRQLRKIEQTN